MDKHNEDEKVLLGSIDELRRVYDHITNIYDQLRVKALALIAGEVAIVTFIFVGDPSRYVPEGVDRLIFFYAGIIALLAAFGLLLWVISSVEWSIPHGIESSKTQLSKHKSYLSFLKYLHDDYTQVVSHCNKIVSNKCKKFNWVVYLLSAGVIILLVVTKFGGRL